MKGAPAQVGQAPGACYAVTMLHSEQDLYLEKALKMDESISLFSLNYTSSHDGCRGPLTFCIYTYMLREGIRRRKKGNFLGLCWQCNVIFDHSKHIHFPWIKMLKWKVMSSECVFFERVFYRTYRLDIIYCKFINSDRSSFHVFNFQSAHWDFHSSQCQRATRVALRERCKK